MFNNLLEQTDAIAKKNSELVVTGVFSFGGMISVCVFAWILGLIEKKRNKAHKQEKEES